MATTIRVCDSETGSVLQGSASEELVRESAEVDTGVVSAYLDAAGVWQYVSDSQVDHYRRVLREDVRTVCVDGAAFAAVGDDGARPVVWGVGSTPDEARADATRWLSECATTETGDDCEIHVITDGQAAIVRVGDVAWPIRVGA